MPSSKSKETRFTAKPHAFAGAVLPPKHARDLTPQQCLAMATALSEQQQQRKTAVPYTVWITEAWRILGWAEPSAALFWEMATMYHALYWKGRTAEDMEKGGFPPILSCGSTASYGSASAETKRKMSASAKELPVWLVGTFLLLHCEEYASQRNHGFLVSSIENEDPRPFLESSTKLPHHPVSSASR